MPLVLVATSGAVNANTYCTLAEAETYYLSRIPLAAWTAGTDATKNAALTMATRLLDLRFEWAEWASTPTQALQWPRAGIMDFLNMRIIDSAVIPQQLKDAEAEFAGQLLAADRSLDSDVETQGITSIKAGSVALTFKDNVYAKVVPDAVIAMIPSWWGWFRGRGFVRELVRG